MRRLGWFAGGFGLACLLAAYGFGGYGACLAAVGLALALLLLWRAVRPGPDESPRPRRPAGKGLFRGDLWQAARRGLAFCLGAALAFAWSAVYSALFYAPAARYVGEEVPIAGAVISYPRKTSIGGWSVTLRLDGPGSPDAVAYGGEGWESLRPGDRVSCTARVAPATRLRGDETTYYTAKGVCLLVYCGAPPETERPGAVPFRYWPALCAQALRRGIALAFDGEAAPLAAAVALGDRSGLSEGLFSALNRAGLMHAAVVSGMHISLLVGLALRLTGRRRRTALLLVPFLLFYALMAGGTPSALRAVVMQAALLAAPLAGRESDAPSALGLALLILLVQNPMAAASVSLQMSFASVAGILLVTPALAGRLLRPVRGRGRNGVRRLLRRLYRLEAETAAASLGAMLFGVPLTALYFGQIVLLGPLSSVLALWALSALLACALVLGPLALAAPGPAAALGRIAGLLGRYAGGAALLLGRFPFASLSTDSPYCVIWLGAGYLVLAACLLPRGRRPRLRVAVPGLALLLLAAVGMGALSVSAGLTVAALDVGQGACTALISGERSALVDCGGNQPSSAGDIAADYFASLGRTRLDLLVLTHLDSDHVNGVEQLFARMDVKAVSVPAGCDAGALAALRERAAAEGAAVTETAQAVRYGLGEAELTLFPPFGGGASNESGQFVLCSRGDFDALITGDAGAFVEKMLVKYCPIPDIELLLAGHHGSKRSTCQELLDAVRPELAVISVGYNSYGHPAEETLARLDALGTRTLRTDRDGTVTVSVRDAGVSVY